MSNPDNKTTTTTFESFNISLPLAIFYAIILFILFMNSPYIPFFSIILWIIFPIFTFLIGSVVNIINQYISCRSTDVGKAFLGAIPTMLSVLLSIVIGNISYCRIPITSVFAPLVLDQSVDVTSNVKNMNDIKKTVRTYCCPSKMTLSEIEDSYPQLKGISIGFYVIFGVLFGNVLGAGISSIC